MQHDWCSTSNSMNSSSHRQWLRKEATDNDEATSDVSSNREGVVFSDSELGESLNEADSNPVPITSPPIPPRCRCCTGLCQLQSNHEQYDFQNHTINQTHLFRDEWNIGSKLLVSDRRKMQHTKQRNRKRPQLLTKRRVRMISVGVQTTPEESEPTSSTTLNPLETQYLNLTLSTHFSLILVQIESWIESIC